MDKNISKLTKINKLKNENVFLIFGCFLLRHWHLVFPHIHDGSQIKVHKLRIGPVHLLSAVDSTYNVKMFFLIMFTQIMHNQKSKKQALASKYGLSSQFCICYQQETTYLIKIIFHP